MTGPRTTPPAAAERLLAAVLGKSDWTDAILGDLHEEYAGRRYRSPALAGSWYWIQVVRLCARSLGRRVHRLVSSLRNALQRPPGEPATRGDSLMRTLGLETRYAFRSIVSRPAMSAVVIATLALALGANAAIFSNIDSLVLRPFTMRDADRIALMSNGRPEDLDRRENVSPADFLDWRKQVDVFERLAALQFWTANLVGRDEPENVQGFFVSADFFPLMGVEPAIGRGFLPAEETIGAHLRVVLGHGLWERRFAGDPSIVGRSIDVDGRQYEVVGVAPPGFDFPMGAQLWAPLAFTPETAAVRRSQYLTVLGRLARGRTLADAQAQMAVVGERIAQEHPDTNRGRVARAYTLAEGMMDIGLKPILSLWQASAWFVLLIACANVANLLLARGAERQREMAVRLAMGASRARVVRELLIESAIFALAAVPGALAVAWICLKLMVGYMPAKIARFVAGWNEMGVNPRLVGFTILLAAITAVIFGLVPAIQASRSRLAETLKEGGRTATAGASRLRLRRGLVIAEMALALPLLVASGLSVMAVHRFLNGPQGYQPDGLLTTHVVLASGRYGDDAARLRFATSAVERLRTIRGVESAAASNVIPSTANNSGRSIEIEGRPNPDPANPPSVDYRTVTPDLLTVLRVPVTKGRGFTDADREDTQLVAIVSESLARTHWPNTDPIGRRIRTGTGPWLTVVGVCGDVIHDWFGRRNTPTIYRPFRQAPVGALALAVRTTGDPAALAVDVRAAIRAVDPAQPIFELRPMRETIRERTIGLRYIGAIMFVFGGLALVLAVVGVYGVMAHMVTQRTHEIGVRIALGATRRDVLTLAVGQTGRLTLIGVAVGVALSFALGRLIEAGLVGIASSDARVIAGVASVLIAAALAAGYIPARRAASIDPVVALRTE
jgi:putative ABC transport system permease protein